jgi:3-oxoacid CoA-transferase subunit A
MFCLDLKMSILLSGDFHASARVEIDLIYKDILIHKYGQERYNGIKYHVILGDGGFMWQHNRERDKRNYEILSQRPFPILCVAGNHEPFYGMKNIPEADIGIGETVYKINSKPFTAYLKRGKVYNIDGIKFLVLGGALSIDKYDRVPNKTWWELEYWTEQEKQDVLKLLETDNQFDFVISHTGPHHINKKLFQDNYWVSKAKFHDEAAYLNDEIHGRIQFREWWCGHFHEDEYYFDKKKKHSYQYLYRSTRIVEKINGRLSVYNGNGGAERECKEE